MICGGDDGPGSAGSSVGTEFTSTSSIHILTLVDDDALQHPPRTQSHGEGGGSLKERK